MAFLIDAAKDGLLNYIKTSATFLHICSGEPATYGGMVSLGSKQTPTSSALGAGSPDGRSFTYDTISSGATVSATGTASHWALTTTNVLIAAYSLSASQAVTSGNPFTLTQFAIRVPNPT